MTYCFLIIIFMIISIFLIFTKSSRVIYLKTLLLPALSAAFILLLIIFSRTAVESAEKGLKLWLNIVFPSLFPFFVASEVLNKTGFIKAAGIFLEPVMRPLFNVPGCGSFALAMGLTSGYPVGAKLTTSMREQELLTKAEAERLLSFTNNSGPLFIVGAVAVGMFKMPNLGVFILLCHMFASLTVGMLFRFYARKEYGEKKHTGNKLAERFKKELRSNMFHNNRNVGEMLGESVKNSINTMLSIGGFIILFSVIINILLEIGFISSFSEALSFLLEPIGINKEIIVSLTSGFFEITTGINMASQATSTTFCHQLSAVSFILGWAGLSVHSQVYSIICKSDISIKPYLFGKLLQGTIAAIYTVTFIKLSSIFNFSSLTVFNPLVVKTEMHWNDYLLNSIKSLSIMFLVLLLLSAISIMTRNLKKVS